MKQRGFAQILILMGILIVSVVGVFYLGKSHSVKQTALTSIETSQPRPTTFPTTGETSAWRTYRNEEYGILIKYPQGYGYGSTGPNNSQKQLNKGQQISENIAPSYDTIKFTGEEQDFSIGIFHTLDANKIADLEVSFDGSCGTQFADKTIVNKLDSVNGIKYRKIQQSISATNNIQLCFLNTANNLIVLSIFGISKEKVEEIDQFLKQILSTVDITATQPSSLSKFTFSPSKQENGVVPESIVSELPKESPDGKEKYPFSFISNNPNFLIYSTFIKQRGAGKQIDYWIFNRKTKISFNMSQAISNDPKFKKLYASEDDPYPDFAYRWQGDNPVFSIADGWSIIGEFWIYDISNNTVLYAPGSTN